MTNDGTCSSPAAFYVSDIGRDRNAGVCVCYELLTHQGGHSVCRQATVDYVDTTNTTYDGVTPLAIPLVVKYSPSF